ncbi:surface lipoprotein assembly modifier [Sulfurovum sp. CS9]|uniref:surface lipoprotein assembly modifier n=1 Tax=Sulfurovum sp. CS9 TaxID=3391146 RepID=UPI0039EAFC11
MKEITALLLMVPITLLAGIAEIQTLYDQKKYAQAISEAQKTTSEYGNPKLHLLWAKSAEALGEDETAMSAYERVLMLDPNDTEVRVHLVKFYAGSDRDELADEMLKSTENYQLTPAQRTSIKTLYGDDIEHLKTSASIEMGYDSNVNVSPGDLDLPHLGEEIDTMFTQFKGSLSYTHELNEKGGWYLRSDADIFYQNNADASYYNLFAVSANIGLGYSNDLYDAFLPISYGYIHYLDRDLLESVSIDPRINFTLSKSFIGNINARYSQRSYLEEEDRNRDDSVTGIGVGLYWLFEKNFAYISTNYDNYSAKYSNSLRFTDKETTRVAMGVNYNVEEWFIARFDYRYRYAKYDDIIESGGDKRSDDYHQAEFKVSRMLTDTMEASLLYRYSKNNSNYELAEYDKDIVMLGIKYNF